MSLLGKEEKWERDPSSGASRDVLSLDIIHSQALGVQTYGDLASSAQPNCWSKFLVLAGTAPLGPLVQAHLLERLAPHNLVGCEAPW